MAERRTHSGNFLAEGAHLRSPGARAHQRHGEHDGPPEPPENEHRDGRREREVQAAREQRDQPDRHGERGDVEDQQRIADLRDEARARRPHLLAQFGQAVEDRVEASRFLAGRDQRHFLGRKIVGGALQRGRERASALDCCVDGDAG